jgi:hypothetical protein
MLWFELDYAVLVERVSPHIVLWLPIEKLPEMADS